MRWFSVVGFCNRTVITIHLQMYCRIRAALCMLKGLWRLKSRAAHLTAPPMHMYSHTRMCTHAHIPCIFIASFLSLCTQIVVLLAGRSPVCQACGYNNNLCLHLYQQCTHTPFSGYQFFFCWCVQITLLVWHLFHQCLLVCAACRGSVCHCWWSLPIRSVNF